MFGIILITVVIAVIVYYNVRHLNYWREKGVDQMGILTVLGQGASLFFKLVPMTDVICNIYNYFPKNRYTGFYQFSIPTLLVKDPELIKQIGVKDFDHFLDHRSFIPEDYEPLWNKNLLNLKGDKWKNMRTTLSPSFTSSKMKAMFHLMSECGESFTNYFLKHSKDCQNVDMKDVLTRYTNDMIGTTAFGIKCDSLEDKNNEFYLMGKEATNITGFWRSFSFSLIIFLPTLGKMLNIRVFSNKVAKFFSNLISEAMKVREEKNIVRQDMLHILMEARKGKQQQDEIIIKGDTGFATVQEHLQPIGKITNQSLTDEDITAQALIFFLGGFETTSQLMNFMSYELAINPDIQQKLQEDIDEVNKTCKGKLTYEALTKMKYLDMVISETLRKWPPLFAVDRVCVKPYTIQPITPYEKPVTLNISDLVWFPIHAIHHDKDYYPNPERFDPERFNEENKSKINPYIYFPFGIGPRNCIGSRFALLEVKILFFHILSKFELVPNQKTPIPMKLQKGVFNVNPAKRIFLTMQARNCE